MRLQFFFFRWCFITKVNHYFHFLYIPYLKTSSSGHYPLFKFFCSLQRGFRKSASKWHFRQIHIDSVVHFTMPTKSRAAYTRHFYVSIRACVYWLFAFYRIWVLLVGQSFGDEHKTRIPYLMIWSKRLRLSECNTTIRIKGILAIRNKQRTGRKYLLVTKCCINILPSLSSNRDKSLQPYYRWCKYNRRSSKEAPIRFGVDCF